MRPVVNPAWILALCALAGVVTGIAAWFGRVSWRWIRRGDQFLEDWNGVTGDSGHEARPGVMARLTRLEQQMNDVQVQMHVNSGHTLRDAVMRIETTTARLEESLNELKPRPPV